MASTRAPFPTEVEDFDVDDRVSYSKTSETYTLEDENGEEWEWLSKQSKWVPVMDEALMEQQRQAYKVEGVDDEAPAMDIAKKRKAAEEAEAASNKATKKQKPQEPRVNKAVYVTSLPEDATIDEIHQTFSKYGVIAESTDNSEPRITMYTDEEGDFKGDALIVYFRPESVQLAIDMLDDSDFRLGERVITGPMRVKAADTSYKSQQDKPLAGDEAKKKGTKSNRDRQKVIKKTEEMNLRLADWDDDDPQAIQETSSRWDKVVVIKHMFTLKEIEEDPEAILDIKEDVREEGEKLGKVTNVVLYDKEEDGIVTVRFSNAEAAKACVRAFQGRFFDNQRLEAYIADPKERFKKSRAGDEEDEKRLRKMS